MMIINLLQRHFRKIRLIFEEKVYLTARKYTNFPDLPMRRHIIQRDFIYASIKEFERCLGGDCGLSREVRTNSSEVSFDSSEVSFDSSEVSFRLYVEDFHSPRRDRLISSIVRFVPTRVGFVSSWLRWRYLLLGRFAGAFPS